MTVLLIGASSQIGHFLLEPLLQRGPVLALSRRPRADREGLRWLRGELPNRLPDALPRLRAVISVGPLDGLARWLERQPLPAPLSVLATSSMSAQSKQASVVAAERELAARLQGAEQRLLARSAAMGWQCTILRPTIVYGTGLDKSFTPMAQQALRRGVFLAPRGRGLRQPVHAQDIAQALLTALDEPARAAGQVLPIGGGERLSATEMFRRVHASLPRRVPLLPLWQAPLRLASRLLPPLRGPVSRLDADLIADNAELVRRLGIQPRPFHPDARCWQAGAVD